MPTLRLNIRPSLGGLTIMTLGVLIGGYGRTQVTHNFGQVISIGQDIEMVLPGDLENDGLLKNEGTISLRGGLNNRGMLTNNGTLSLAGDWNNQNIYNEGTGTVLLQGGDQEVFHNDQSIYSLAMSGGGDKTFKSDITVTNSLTLDAGIIKFDQVHRLLIASTASLTGGSTSSYVSGPLYHQGPGYKFFPIGKSGLYRPAILEDVGGIDPIIGMEMFQPNPYSEREFDLEEISPTRYWKMDVGGTLFEGSILSLALADDGLADEVDKLVIAEAPAEGKIFVNLGRSKIDGSAGQVGMITSKDPATGGVYALGLASERQPEDLLFVPNSVHPASPNPDDRVAKVYGARISLDNFLFRIYNRWGGSIYETRSFETASQEGWDGSNANSGQEESTGTFKYVLTGYFDDGTPFSKVGSIVLMR